MRTECKQARFEFHGLFQRKVKARFDGGKITSDAGVLLLREVERGTGLIAGLAECFRDHRDPRLIELRTAPGFPDSLHFLRGWGHGKTKQILTRG